MLGAAFMAKCIPLTFSADALLTPGARIVRRLVFIRLFQQATGRVEARHFQALREFQTKFASEEACQQYLVSCRWPDGFVSAMRVPMNWGDTDAGNAAVGARFR